MKFNIGVLVFPERSLWDYIQCNEIAGTLHEHIPPPRKPSYSAPHNHESYRDVSVNQSEKVREATFGL